MHLLNFQPNIRICFSTWDYLIARKRWWIASFVATFQSFRAEYAPPATHARLYHLIVERRSARLRAPLHHLEPEVGGAWCLDRASPPQFDPLRVETLKEPNAITK